MTAENNKNLELYIHTPFCVKKCDYCDFLSFPGDSRTQMQYVHGLLQEIRFYGEQMGEYAVPTIYIGGGTPSWLEPELMTAVMDQVFSSFHVLPGLTGCPSGCSLFIMMN